jgi:hypothetical protein
MLSIPGLLDPYVRTTCSPPSVLGCPQRHVKREKKTFNPFPGQIETPPKHFWRGTIWLLMEKYITITPFVTRQATYSCRLRSFQLTLAMVRTRESPPSLVFDQEPTTHAVLVRYILGLTHSTIRRDAEARPRNKCCSGKPISNKYYERVCSYIFCAASGAGLALPLLFNITS